MIVYFTLLVSNFLCVEILCNSLQEITYNLQIFFICADIFWQKLVSFLHNRYLITKLITVTFDKNNS